MNKLVYAALIASSASAEHRLNVFAAENFLSKNLVQSLIKTAMMDTPNDVGKVVYNQCDDDAGAFTLDTKQTSNSPDPVTKGQDVSLKLRGIVDENVEVDNLHVHVDWNGSTLYDEDIKGVNTYTSTYQYDVSWNVPSYAPSGAYAVTITGTGKTDDTSGKVICVGANFSL